MTAAFPSALLGRRLLAFLIVTLCFGTSHGFQAIHRSVVAPVRPHAPTISSFRSIVQQPPPRTLETLLYAVQSEGDDKVSTTGSADARILDHHS